MGRECTLQAQLVAAPPLQSAAEVKNAESQGRLPHANVNISESTSEKAHIII